MDSTKELLTNELKKYEYIIFDFDKTICELMVNWGVLKKELSDFILDHHWDHIVFTPIDESLNLVRSKYWQWDLLKLYKIIESFEINWGYTNVNNTIVNHILKNHKHFAIYSMNMTRTINAFLKDLRILKQFDLIIWKDNCISHKPSWDDIDFIVKKWNIDKKRVLFIWDSSNDLLSWKEAGIKTFIL